MPDFYQNKTEHFRQRLMFFPRISLLPMLLYFFLSQPISTSNIAVSIEKNFAGKQPEGSVVFQESGVISPDIRHFAYVAVSDDGMQVCVDKHYGKKYDHIAKGYPIFSPAGNRVGYIADRADKHFVVIDKKEYPGYDGACCLKFSPNGKYAAYIAQEKNKQFVVLNGHRMNSFDMIDRIFGVLFSPDSTRAAYVAKDATSNNVRLIVNGVESHPFSTISEIAFSPDSKSLAYIATRDREYFVIREDQKEGPYDKVEGLTWSPDSSQLAYVAIKNGKFLVVNNELETYAGEFSPQTFFYESGGYASRVQQITPPVFSPDGSVMAFTKLEKEKFRYIIGETTGPPFDFLSTAVFSPDSTRYAYVGATQTKNNIKMQVLSDRGRGPFYDEVDLLVFSPDSKHLAYRARIDDKWFLITDGKAHKAYDLVDIPYFSPDSYIVAYRAVKGNNAIMVVNGIEYTYKINNPFNIINKLSSPCFSPDSRYIAYLVQRKPLECLLVINGFTIETFNSIFITTEDLIQSLAFDSENTARFIAGFLNGDRFEAFRIDITIDGQP